MADEVTQVEGGEPPVVETSAGAVETAETAETPDGQPVEIVEGSEEPEPEKVQKIAEMTVGAVGAVGAGASRLPPRKPVAIDPTVNTGGFARRLLPRG